MLSVKLIVLTVLKVLRLRARAYLFLLIPCIVRVITYVYQHVRTL